jgi:hypothetical protein
MALTHDSRECVNESCFDDDLSAWSYNDWFSQEDNQEEDIQEEDIQEEDIQEEDIQEEDIQEEDNYDTSYEGSLDDNSSMYNSACELPETANFKEWFLDFANNNADESANDDEPSDDVPISIKSRSRRMLEAIDWINRNYKMESSMTYYNRYKRNAMFEPIPFNLFLGYI